MSLISHAKAELARINFGDEDTAVMVGILETFFEQWDSGGAVWAVAPVLQRLIAGKPLSPLTGEPDEWLEVGDGVFQNKRLGSVFKDPRFHDGKLAYDLDNPAGPRVAIEFPYDPVSSAVPSPVITIGEAEPAVPEGLQINRYPLGGARLYFEKDGFRDLVADLYDSEDGKRREAIISTLIASGVLKPGS